MYRWMRKHGVENIVSVVLGTANSPEGVCLLEIRLIAEMHTHVSDGGLNCTRGGDGSLGWNQSPESIAKANASRAKTRGYVGRKPHKPPKPKPWEDPEVKRQRFVESRARGEESGMSKLTLAQVTVIKSLICNKTHQRDIAKIYGVSQCNISAIASEKTWKYVPWPSARVP